MLASQTIPRSGSYLKNNSSIPFMKYNFPSNSIDKAELEISYQLPEFPQLEHLGNEINYHISKFIHHVETCGDFQKIMEQKIHIGGINCLYRRTYRFLE